MDVEDMSTQKKQENKLKGIATKSLNLKIWKFNNFNSESNKRNKAEQKLYMLLNEEQKNNFIYICQVLAFGLAFFQECYDNQFILTYSAKQNIYYIMKGLNKNEEDSDLKLFTLEEIASNLTAKAEPGNAEPGNAEPVNAEPVNAEPVLDDNLSESEIPPPPKLVRSKSIKSSKLKNLIDV